MPAAILLPARLESTRLPRKLLLDRTGRPLICHTVDAAEAARRLAPDRIGEIVVAADAEEIRQAVAAYVADRGIPARAVLTRADHQSGSDRIAEAAAELPAGIDVLVNLQGDEPEIPPQALLQLLDALEEGGDIATLAYPLRDEADLRNPNLVKVVRRADGAALYFSRATIPFDRDGPPPAGVAPALGHMGVYAYRRAALERFVQLPPGVLERRERLEQLRALEHGMTIAVAVLDAPPPKGIDTDEDYNAFVARMGQV